MTDLGVAHLAGRQPDRLFGRLKDAVRPSLKQTSPDRHRRCLDGVSCRVTPDPEAIEHDEDDRSGPGDRHPVRPRAEAVIPARATIPAISSGLSEAPPTSAPSMDGSARNSPMFADVTLPP